MTALLCRSVSALIASVVRILLKLRHVRAHHVCGEANTRSWLGVSALDGTW